MNQKTKQKLKSREAIAASVAALLTRQALRWHDLRFGGSIAKVEVLSSFNEPAALIIRLIE
jgi:hypothetical protein